MMHSPLATCVLFAAGFDWLEALLPFLFVAFWIVSQVFAVFRRLQGGGRQQQPLPRPRFDPGRDRPRPVRRVAEPDGDLRSDLEKQIAEFLREATGDKKPQPAVKKTKPVKPVVVARQESPRSDADRREPPASRGASPVRLEERQPKKVVSSREAEASPKAAVSPEHSQTGESVAQHVQGAFARELSHLRGAITQDQSQPGAAPRAAAPTQAEELVHLLRNPATIRQVILLREVLDRPVDRW